MMKIILKVIAWIGLGFMTVATYLAFSESWANIIDPRAMGNDFIIPIAQLLSALGLVLILVGGLIAKPRYFWLVSIIIGMLNIISFSYGLAREWSGPMRYYQLDILIYNSSLSLFPGLITILEGILLKHNRAKTRIELDHNGAANVS